MNKKIGLIICLLLSISLFTACTPSNNNPDELGKGIVVGIAADTPAIAPGQFNNTTGFYIATMTHNGLFRIDAETLQPVPDLVKEWSNVSNTVFEFKIHEGIKFHNGEEMTSADIIASFDYVKTFPISINSMRSLVSYEAIDEYTVRINTGFPNSMLLFDLASHPTFIMPKSLIDADHDFNKDPVGSGPYKASDLKPGDYYKFDAFEDYFDKERASKVASVTLRIIPEGFSRTLALETGEIDFNVSVQPQDIGRMYADPNISVINKPGTQHVMLYLNNELPQFNTVEKRRIISMAIDKEAMMLAAYEGNIQFSNAHAPLVFDGSTVNGAPPFDPDGAKELLEELGINPASLGFEIIAAVDVWAVQAQVIQDNLAKIGIPVTIVRLDVPATQQRLNAGNYQAAFMGFTQPNLLGFMRLNFHSSNIGTINRVRLNDPVMDALINSAVAETVNVAARTEFLRQAVVMANENAYLIPSHTNMLQRAHNAKLVVPEVAATDFPLYLNMVYWND
jgi:peptide/nickel transport system substrate-binding protein